VNFEPKFGESLPESREAADSGDLSGLSDHTLIALIRQGRDDAATALYGGYAARLRSLAGHQLSTGLARKVEPDDIVQSVFRSFFRRASQGLYDVPRHEELWGLLLVSALNKIRSHGNYFGAAKRDAKRSVSVDDVPEPARGDSDPVALADLRMAIEDGLARLPDRYRSVVEHRIAGDDVADIAKKVGRAKRSVERMLQEFRQVLLDLVEAGNEK